jgi:potassium efflux system protein
MSPRPSSLATGAAVKSVRLPFYCAVLVLALVSSGISAPAQAGSSAAKFLLGSTEQKPAIPAPQPTPAPAPAATTASLAIPLPDVAARSEDLQRSLRAITDKLPTTDQLNAITATLNQYDRDLQSRQEEMGAMLGSTPSPMELREDENYWRSKQKETANTRRQLHDWANAAQSAIQQLQAQLPVWNATLEENQATPGLGPALDAIQQTVASLKKLLALEQNQLRTVVNLQVHAATQDQLALDMLDRLNQAREMQDSRLFQRESLPLWELSQRRQEGENREIYLSASARLGGIGAFAAQTQGPLALLAVVLILSLLGAYRLRLASRDFRPTTPEQAQVLQIARHWIALGLLPPLLFGYLLAPLAPVSLIGLVILISFFPILTLLPLFLTPHIRLLLRYLAGVYTLSALIAWISFSPALKREVQFGIHLGIFLLFLFLIRPARLSHLDDAGRAHTLRFLGIRLAVVILGAALAANLFGYVRLAQFLAILCLYSTFIAIAMLAGTRVFTRLVLEGVDRPGAQQIAAVRLYRDGIVRWVPRLLQWAALLMWLTVTINLLGLSGWIGVQLKELAEFHIAGGGANVTLGGVLGFFAILLVGYLISSVFRFLLREELLSRFHLSRGLPELIASTLHYLLLLLVFFFAINAGGVQLNKFTVLTGALGVGVGFGLQNIVNNFISGLILQFERPIHIGDVLDVDGTTGKVTRIGIRSSTVKTFQGAEVIIPNGNFISSKVINWTLSESLRRVDLPVGVAYGTDAKLTCKLLEQAATTNESVLTSPVPAVYFKEFGDSSLNFELQFWVMQESNTVKVKSEVALEVMRLLDCAGIEIPFPQRDLRLRAVDETAAATLLSAKESSDGMHGDRSGALESSLLLDQAKPRNTQV